MKKVVLFCLSVLFMTTTVFSQISDLKGKQVQKSNVQKELIQKVNQTWEVQFTDTIDQLCSKPTGTVSDGTYLYACCLDKTMIYKIDSIHKVIDTMTITGVPAATQVNVKLFGLAYDGSYFYSTNGNDSIYQIDLTTKSVTNIITLPTGTIPMGLTYSPDADGGNGGFWVSVFSSNSLMLFSTSGVLLDSITGLDSNFYYSTNFLCALAYDNVTPGGPFLYALDYLTEFIISINLSNKGINSEIHYVSDDMIDWEPLNAYGIYIQPDVVPGTYTLGVVYNSGQHIGYNLNKLELPQGLSIVNSFTKPWLKTGETGVVSANVYCSGRAPITSYNFNYTIDGNLYTQSINGATIANGYYNPVMLIHDSIIASMPEGTHSLEIWFSNINGQSYLISDTVSMLIDVYQKVTQRTVLHEEFVSSTSTNCKIPNMLLDTIFHYNPNKFTCIKYQMNSPALDPYYTLEGEARRTYYEVANDIPYLAVDGNYFNFSPLYYSASFFQLEYIQPSFVEMSATFNYNEAKNYSTSIKVTPLKTYTGNYKLYAAIVEKVTHMNMKTNGESSFYYVMKKFMTDVNGNAITLTDNQDVNVDLAFKFNGKYRLPFKASDLINNDIENSVEDFNNLMLVYWIQEYDTKEVIQSGKVDAATIGIEDYQNQGSIKVYPNPSDGKINIQSDEVFSNVKVLNMLGQTVYNVTITTNNYSFQTTELVSGVYILQLQTKNGIVNRKISVK